MLLQKIQPIPYFWIFVGGLLLSIYGCNTTKFLSEDEAFLVENEIILNDKKALKEYKSIRKEFDNLFLQSPNSKSLFGVPKQWYYYKYEPKSDSSKFSSFILKNFGEPPSLFDTTMVRRTEENIVNYIRSRGFFDASVNSYTDFKGKNEKKIEVKYQLSPGRPYLIDEIKYTAQDDSLQLILDDLVESSLLKKGNLLDKDLFISEKRRITEHIKNLGYADFSTQYVSDLRADTSENQIRVSLKVLDPGEGEKHKKYRIGNIYIYPNYDNSTDFTPVKYDSLGLFIKIIYGEGDFRIRKQVFNNSIYLRHGDIYQQENLERTSRRLSLLETYRFVNIRKEVNAENPELLDFHFYLIPNKKYVFGADLEVNTSINSIISQRLLGLSGNLSFEHRNLFKGGESLQSTIEAGVSVGVGGGATDSLNTSEIKLSSNLNIPRFIDYFHFWRTISKPYFQNLKATATTKVGLSYEYVNNNLYYTIHSFNTSFGYVVNRDRRSRYSFSHFGINFFLPNPTKRFEDDFLTENPYLANSFSRQLLTGFLLRDFQFQKNSPVNRFKESSNFLFTFEMSGAEIYLANLLGNALSGKDNIWSLSLGNEDIDFSHYFRFDIQQAYRRELTNKTSLALRYRIGIAIPYGFKSEAIPFVKQFYVGGPESLRGWPARSIGPGGFNTTKVNSLPGSYFQSGDFRLEFNAEYRFSLFSIAGINFDSALFLDGGNVWLLREGEEDDGIIRRRSNILFKGKYIEDGDYYQSNFLRYIAINAGTGLRLDFSFFVLRLDLGIKLRNAYPRNEGGPITRDSGFSYKKDGDDPLNRMNFNLGLGYPF